MQFSLAAGSDRAAGRKGARVGLAPGVGPDSGAGKL
jgi:hypothetical protein